MFFGDVLKWGINFLGSVKVCVGVMCGKCFLVGGDVFVIILGWLNCFFGAVVWEIIWGFELVFGWSCVVDFSVDS